MLFFALSLVPHCDTSQRNCSLYFNHHATSLKNIIISNTILLEFVLHPFIERLALLISVHCICLPIPFVL